MLEKDQTFLVAEKKPVYKVVRHFLLPASKKNLHGYISNNNVSLVRAGKGYFELLLQMINKAQEIIHLQTYIYDRDETGKRIGDALIAAAKKGVQVYVMADGYASRSLSESFIQRLKEAGVHFRFFEPVFRSKHFYLGRRLHHKVIVVDQSFALVGGINIGNRYNDMPGQPAWLDFALCLQGEICKDLHNLCRNTWQGFLPANKNYRERKPIHLHIDPKENCFVRMRRNDWVKNKNQISRSYLEMFRNANSYITIVSSYFLPGKTFRKNMAAASKRGVKIKVVLTDNSDVMLAKYAERYMYRWLLKNNIEIYEYKPNVLHGKLAFFDDKWTTAGSYNVNNISAYASVELNLDVRNERFTKNVSQIIEKIIEKDCVRVTETYLRSHNHFFQRIWQKICSDIIRMIFYIFTFYFRQEH